MNKTLPLTLVACLLFAQWIIPQIYIGDQIFYQTIMTSSSTLQSLYSWMPMLKNLELGGMIAGIRPNATLIVYSTLLNLFGINGIIILGSIVLPTACFYLLMKIFQRNLSLLWSTALSFIALIVSTEYPLRAFLEQLFSITQWEMIGSKLQPLEILSFPFPALSTFCFLLLFYLSTAHAQYTLKRVSFFTVLWAAYTQIHLVDAIFGLIFWFTYFPIRVYRQNAMRIKYLIKITVTQLILVVCILSPIIYYILLQPYDLSKLLVNPSQDAISMYYYLAYLVVPLVLIIVIFKMQRVDPFEVLFKFWHVYVLMGLEWFLLGLLSSNVMHADLFVLQNRIALFFLHLYYYVPVIYFATKNQPRITFKSSRLEIFYQHGILWCFNKLHYIYLPMIIGCLFGYSVISAFQFFKHQQDISAQIQYAASEFPLVEQLFSRDSVYVSEHPAFNLLASVASSTKRSTLWTNRFFSSATEYEAIEKFILYGKIFAWDEEKFVQFMMPGKLQARQNELVLLTKENMLNSGVPYWLIFHKFKKTEAALDEYQKFLHSQYANLDIYQLMIKYGVKQVHAYGKISSQIPSRVREKGSYGIIYDIIYEQKGLKNE